MRSPSCLCACEPFLMKLGMYACIMTTEPNSTAYFINPSHESVYSPIVATQQLGKNVTAATNIHARTQLLEASSSMRSVSYQGNEAITFLFLYRWVLYSKIDWPADRRSFSIPPRGGGVEYLHRDPASRRRRRKGKSRIWDSKMWPRVLWDSDQKMTALARTSRNCKRQTRSLVREGAPNQQTRNCQTIIKIWS
jgi:hypothetical protein